MYETIIVGVDGRQGGRDALALAATLARAGGGTLVAVHAYPHDYYISRGAVDEYELMLRSTAEESLAAELKAAGVEARPVVTSDESPGRALHRVARKERADLIVVGSAHRGRVGRILAGDVTAATLHGAECPVLVAPAGYEPHAPEIVGVGFDGSFESHAAVEAGRALAEALGAQLRIISVISPVVPGGPYPVYRPDWSEVANRRREEAEKLVRDVVAPLGDRASGELTVGDPAEELSYEANGLDLLVVGSRGYGPVHRLMLGSTSSKLVHRAPCPVLVLPRTAPEELDQPEPAAASTGSEGS